MANFRFQVSAFSEIPRKDKFNPIAIRFSLEWELLEDGEAEPLGERLEGCVFEHCMNGSFRWSPPKTKSNYGTYFVTSYPSPRLYNLVLAKLTSSVYADRLMAVAIQPAATEPLEGPAVLEEVV